MNRATILVVLVACRFDFDARDAATDGAVAPFVPSWTSGPRIRARRWSPKLGGDPVFAGWHDTQTDTDCASVVASDGVERCMPGHSRADVLFSDAGCTNPLAFVPRSQCGHDRFAVQVDTMNRYHAFPIAGGYSGPVWDSRIGCAPASGLDGTLYAIGPEEPAGSFSAAQYHNALVGGYLHLFAGFSDGASRDLGRLVLGQNSCAPTGKALGTAPCEPEDSVLAPVYRDAACTQRAYLGGDPSITEFIVDEPSLCGVAYGIYQVTANVTAATYYTLGTACTPQTTPIGGVLLTATPIADPYPIGTVHPGPRRGPLGTLYWTGPDGADIALAPWDHDLGLPCFPFVAQDGVFRCLPRRPKLTTAHLDPSCASPPVQVGGACYGVPPLDGPSYPSCDDGAWTVTAIPEAAPAVSFDAESSCQVIASPAYQTGTGTTTIAPTMFPELVETVE